MPRTTCDGREICAVRMLRWKRQKRGTYAVSTGKKTGQNTQTETETETETETDAQTQRHIDTQTVTDRQTNRQTDRRTDRQTHGWSGEGVQHLVGATKRAFSAS